KSFRASRLGLLLKLPAVLLFAAERALGAGPEGFAVGIVAQSAGLDPSGGMHLRPSPGMLPGAGVGLAATHSCVLVLQLPPTCLQSVSVWQAAWHIPVRQRVPRAQ